MAIESTFSGQVWHLPYTAEQIQAAIGKGPILAAPDENGDCYWMVWDIEKMQYVNTGFRGFLGDISKIEEAASNAALSAEAANRSQSTATNASWSAVRAAVQAQQAADSIAAAGGGGGSSAYSSDLFLFLSGKHPMLNAGPYSDYEYIDFQNSIALYPELADSIFASASNNALDSAWRAAYGRLRPGMSRSVRVSTAPSDITVYDNTLL